MIGVAPANTAVGDLMDLFLKPERIGITASGDGLDDDAINQLEGTLRDVIFKGPYLDCLVALGSGLEITVSAPPEAAGLERGAVVHIGWSVDAAAVFPVETL